MKILGDVLDVSNIRFFFGLVLQKGSLMQDLDIRTVLFRGHIDSDVYIYLPVRLEVCLRNAVLKLRNGPYRLKEAPHL